MQYFLKLLDLFFLQNETARSVYRLLRCDVMWSHRNLPAIQRKILFPLWGHENALKMTENSANFYQTTLVTFQTIILKVT